MLYSLIQLVQAVGMILTVLVFARVIVSWVSPDPRNPLVAFIYRTTEPMLGPIRNLLPVTGGLDFSPLILLVLIQVAERLLIQLIVRLA